MKEKFLLRGYLTFENEGRRGKSAKGIPARICLKYFLPSYFGGCGE
jgi:hypothetical protein